MLRSATKGGENGQCASVKQCYRKDFEIMVVFYTVLGEDSVRKPPQCREIGRNAGWTFYQVHLNPRLEPQTGFEEVGTNPNVFTFIVE